MVFRTLLDFNTRLGQLIDSPDERVAGAAVKLCIDKGLPPVPHDNPFQVPPEFLGLPPEEKLAWMKRQQAIIAHIVGTLEGQLAEGTVVVKGELP